MAKWTADELILLCEMHGDGKTLDEIAASFPDRSYDSVGRMVWRVKRGDKGTPTVVKEGANLAGGMDDQILTLRTKTDRSLEAALATGMVDLKVWDVERWVLNKWDVAAKVEVGGDMRKQLAATELWQVKVWFRRKSVAARAVEELLGELKKHSVSLPKLKPHRPKAKHKRTLEICLMDPHLGMHCFPPQSDHAWSVDDCIDICGWALEGLIALAEPYGPFEEVVYPFGNDFMHADNIQGTTTAGTGQPEAEDYYYTYKAAMKLAIAQVQRMREIAPVTGYLIQGNHDALSTFTLGQVLWAYFHADQDVTIDASSSPYKFHRCGTNLIGYEHGHSVAQVRLAALMANERPRDWAETSYREWHVGDQHRKGSAKPSAMEEQGVSVEFLPGLTPPNQWHRRKSYNWQKRGAMCFVWDHDTGPCARLQVNLDSYTGLPTGSKRKESYVA